MPNNGKRYDCRHGASFYIVRQLQIKGASTQIMLRSTKLDGLIVMT